MLVPFSWLKEYVDIDITPQELEKKLFDYFNQEVFRDDNGTAVSPAMGCAVGPPPLLWAVLTPGPPITSGWALPGVPPASGQAASTRDSTGFGA